MTPVSGKLQTAWSVPPLPNTNHASRVTYWLAMLAIPNDEPAARLLHAMAAQRLVELGALPAEAVADILE